MSPDHARLVTLGAPGDPAGVCAQRAIADSPTSVEAALETALALGALSVFPGGGSTRDLWEALATIAAVDLGAARVVEPHLDATAILHEAGNTTDAVADPARTWGVFAAEGGPDPLTATAIGDDWLLSGTKPWCSLAQRLSHALVTAHVGSERSLFVVDLRSHGVRPEAGVWHARGLAEISSSPVRFDAVVARQIAEPGWYLSRAGFAWGGIGVAACWFGGAVGIARTVYASVAEHGADASPLLLMHLGAIDALLEDARRALAEAASAIDDGSASGAAGSLLAKRVRTTVALACEEVIARSGHALGPAPLALDESHAKRVADLALYVRQHHAERDLASLGATLVRGTLPW